jgi:hypothetical protein
MAVSLSMTGIVFLLLGDYSARLADERGPLLRGLMWSWSALLIAVPAFYGELKTASWRRLPQCGLCGYLLWVGWVFWPT